MVDLRIARLRKRYRLDRESAPEQRARFDRVLMAAIDEGLVDMALERAGIATTDEICVRSVVSTTRFDVSQPDSRLAAQWSIALADAIAETLLSDDPGVVRYRSRHHALADMACSAARGDLSRAWAWRQLGLWTADDSLTPTAAASEAIEALAREPRAVPAVLSVVASAGLLNILITGASAAAWLRLARAALAAHDAAPALSRALDDATSSMIDSHHGLVARILATSVILAELPRVGTSPATARALAALALLEREPWLVTDGDPALITMLAAHAASTAHGPGRAPARTDARIADDASTPVRGRSDDSIAQRAADDDAAPPNDAPANERARATTAYGGLLFLLHLIHAVGLPQLPERSLRWTMHRLALTLVPLSDDDCAAMAFAGLAPDSRFPSDDEPPETAEEHERLLVVRAAIVNTLRVRLASSFAEGRDETDEALLQRIARRTAEIVADPAWIEARFAMADATTDVRRAGLDIDPGWLPWLGVVVRFVYA